MVIVKFIWAKLHHRGALYYDEKGDRTLTWLQKSCTNVWYFDELLLANSSVKLSCIFNSILISAENYRIDNQTECKT